MRPDLERDGHDPRTIDLIVVISLLMFVFGSVCFLSAPKEPPTVVSFIVPSQSVRW